MDEKTTLDKRRIEALLREILKPVNANYKNGPSTRDRVYEALNALAAATGIVIDGAGSHEALDWFLEALFNHVPEQTMILYAEISQESGKRRWAEIIKGTNVGSESHGQRN